MIKPSPLASWFLPARPLMGGRASAEIYTIRWDGCDSLNCAKATEEVITFHTLVRVAADPLRWEGPQGPAPVEAMSWQAARPPSKSHM